jgi:hypothetical protein
MLDFFCKRWLRIALRRRILPLPVTWNRFAAALRVLSLVFAMILESHGLLLYAPDAGNYKSLALGQPAFPGALAHGLGNGLHHP